MTLRTKLLFVVSILALLPIALTDLVHPLFLIAAMVVLAATCWIALFSFEAHRAETKTLREEVERLKKGYEEMDEHAKLIVKTDIELHRTQTELDRKINSLYTLHQLGTLLSRAFDQHKLFELITDDIILELGFEKGLIILFQGDHLPHCQSTFRYSTDESSALVAAVTANHFAPICDLKGKSVVMSKQSTANQELENISELLGVSSFASVPILLEQKPFGYIICGTTLAKHRITEGDVEILSVLANQISVALENAKLYEETWKSHRELELRVQQRTRELAEANRELQQISRKKTDFVSAVSHELRTPLTSIKGYANILMSGKLGELSAPIKERLSKVDKQSNKLVQLINDLLDISRIESGRVEMTFHQVQIRELIDTVIDLVKPQVKEKQIQVGISITNDVGYINADSNQLERVFINLLSNALKYTPEHGQIHINVSKDTDGLYRFEVADTGVGIPENDIPKLFEEFFRANNQTHQQGTGLGLSLVKRIIQAHNGTIWVESALNQGTKFIFQLPVDCSHHKENQ